jgi:hypothetical protein
MITTIYAIAEFRELRDLGSKEIEDGHGDAEV